MGVPMFMETPIFIYTIPWWHPAFEGQHHWALQASCQAATGQAWTRSPEDGKIEKWQIRSTIGYHWILHKLSLKIATSLNFDAEKWGFWSWHLVLCVLKPYTPIWCCKIQTSERSFHEFFVLKTVVRRFWLSLASDWIDDRKSCRPCCPCSW